jgi:hypothetical protein
MFRSGFRISGDVNVLSADPYRTKLACLAIGPPKTPTGFGAFFIGFPDRSHSCLDCAIFIGINAPLLFIYSIPAI